MPIGAAIGGGVLAAGGSVIAGSKAAKAQKNAAQTASDTSLAVARENNALIRETRDQNVALAQPFYDRGNEAGSALQGLLLGPSSSAPAFYSTGALDTYLANNPDVAADYASNPTIDHNRFQTPEDWARYHYNTYGRNEGWRTAPVATNPWDTFRNSTNYQFRLDEGNKALTTSLAARGALDSGAAAKAAIKYNQNFAANELGNYMNLLAQQQNVGLSAGNAVMGVSTNATNAITAQNTNAGNTAANAALATGQANAGMWGTIGNAAGQLGGALFQYGTGQFRPPPVLPATGGETSYNIGGGTSNYFAAHPFG